MAHELEKVYHPQEIEKKIYTRWEKSGFFNPEKLPGKRTKRFSLAMPPPNVTGELHLGHATGLTVQDILTRFERMRGKKALFLPGTDHAGISTQVMVERLIQKEGLSKTKLGRQKFLTRVWKWKQQYGSRITKQIRQIGASCDWSRERFTMDPELTEAVQKAFITMYNDGLIYRGKRIVNWDIKSGSALSDLEVKHVETNGKLWYIRYPLFGTTKYLVVATTRPETMLGDTAVAVHPKDKRYNKFVGQSVLLPILNRELPIIADRRVDRDFGTGAVKITPAHDHLDYEIGEDHKLPIINVIGPDGRMTKEAGPFYGKSTQEARHAIITKLEKEELLEKIEDYVHNQARSERTGAPIEPLISEQWFVKINKLAKPALAAVKQGKIQIVPKRFEKIYFHWMKNIKDWCISRQLWWGHQIPVWYKNDKIKAAVKQPGPGWRQDPDTLDTWFSSGLWTFSTLGWPKKTKDLKLYHPTDVMETAWDILFFWIARMIMMSLYFLKEVPFRTVYLHGLVLDKDGQKMSKSKGTGIDPIIMTKKYGTDAIRLSLIMGTTAGQDSKLYEEKIAGNRNFINKLWNISRFVLSHPAPRNQRPDPITLADRWILSRLQYAVSTITKKIEQYHFSEAATILYDFVWRELADWYLEIAKKQSNPALLRQTLTTVLKLSHPFLPFVTEEIWSRWQGTAKNDLLMIQDWPKPKKIYINKKAEQTFKKLQNFIVAIRNFRAEQNIPTQEKVPVLYNGTASSLIINNIPIIQTLAQISRLNKSKLKKITGSIGGVDYYIDYQQNSEARHREIKKTSAYIHQLEQKLNNKNFLAKAPAKIVNKERQKLAEQKNRLQKLMTK